MRIRTQIVAAALLVTAAVNVVFAIHSLDRERILEVGQLRARMAATGALLQVVMAGPLYDLNVEQIDTNLDSFFADPDIVEIALQEERGDIARSRRRSNPDVRAELLSSKVVVKRGNDRLGQVSVLYTTANIEKRLTRARDEMLLFSGALALALLAVIVLVARGLTRPIDRLTAAARAMADGDLQQRIEGGGSGELAVLADSFMRLRDAIREKIASLAEQNRRLNEEMIVSRQLAQERDRLAWILESTTDLVGMADPQQTIIYMNHAGRVMTGSGETPLPQIRIADLHPEWARRLVLDVGIPTAIRDGVWSGETALRLADGGEMPTSQVILSRRDAAGNLETLSTIIRDISETKRVERELRASQAQLATFKRLTDSSGQAIGFASLDSRIIYANQALRRLLTLPAEADVTQHSFYDFYTTADRARLDAEVLPAVRASGQWAGELGLRAGNGGSLPTIQNVFMLHDEDGRPSALAAIITDISELRRSQEALQQSEERLRHASRVSQIGIFDHDHRSDTVYWSPETRRIFGWGDDDAVSLQAFLAAVHPEDRDRIGAIILGSFEPGGDSSFEFEHRIVRHDGEIRWLSARGQTFFTGDGQTRRPARTIGATIDITERKQNQAAIERHNLMLRTIASITEQLLGEMPQAELMNRFCHVLVDQGGMRMAWIGMLDPGGTRVTPVAKAGLEDGYIDEADIRCDRSPLGQGPTGTALRLERTVINDDTESNEQFAPWRESARRRGYRSSAATPIRLGERVIGAVSVYSAVPHAFGPDEVVLLEKLAADLGHALRRQATEAELRRYREDLEELVAERTRQVAQQARIIDQIHDSVVVTDLSGIIVGWNKGAERQFGYSGEEALGRFVGFLYPPEEHDFLRDEIIARLQRDGSHEVETRLRRKHDQDFVAHLSLSMLYDDSGTAQGMVGYSIDISARKRAEALLRQRTQELAATNTELEAFSYSVSHDLRAPLRAIDGFSQVLLEDYAGSLDATALDYLQRVRAGAQRMGMLIDNLLRLSRVTRSSMEHKVVDLSELADAILAQLRSAEAGRQVDTVVAPGLRAWGDAGLLRIALENLLGNAWKFTARRPQARIEFGQMHEDGRLVYHVTDNGAGFDMRYAGKLFGAFQRLHHADEFEGTGVGLATVQRIIHRHGGSIWAQAAPGAGASFRFTLPWPDTRPTGIAQ